MPGFIEFHLTTVVQKKRVAFSFTFSNKEIGFGLFYQFKRLIFSTQYTYHYILGGSPEMQLTYQWN